MISSYKSLSDRLLALKANAGTHSPSIQTIRSAIPDLEIKIDACFLSNPYATDLFLQELSPIIQDQRRIRELIEYYPSQNKILAELLAGSLGVNPAQIIVGNGAIELIEYSMKNFVGKRVALPLPTFSSYYEAINGLRDVKFFNTRKENDYAVDVCEFSNFIKDQGCDSAVLINPGNPTGQYIPQSQIHEFLEKNQHLACIVLDESFIHFAFEDDSDLSPIRYYDLVEDYPNLIIIKSLSKDFGVAGIRAGYMVAAENRVHSMLETGFLWNTNGLAEFFIRTLADQSFIQKYEVARRKYIAETLEFSCRLASFGNYHTLPAKSNFVLLEVLYGSATTLFDFLLVKHGIYVRECSDKIGLDGNYIRIASRSSRENEMILEALKQFR